MPPFLWASLVPLRALRGIRRAAGVAAASSAVVQPIPDSDIVVELYNHIYKYVWVAESRTRDGSTGFIRNFDDIVARRPGNRWRSFCSRAGAPAVSGG